MRLEKMKLGNVKVKLKNVRLKNVKAWKHEGKA